ncbi:MAG: endolytic transglycosylase MltG, partial [Clostridiales bacterium]|nr:endolytic transglycosylase MltG [Clostridiales bacterium]
IRQQILDTGYSINEILTIASMIEKETDGTDRAKIASVIYNRLNNPGGGTNGYLQIDATIQYVLPEGEIVSEEDYQTVDSPYNTYLNKGLPPGPIANPGMESIMAALNPESTNYYYYALGDDDLHHFFSTYSEHQAFLNS